MSPSIDNKKDKKIIKKNFVDICKRSGIKLNNNLPVYLEDCHLGMEYLQYRGFNPQSVDYFTSLYQNKWKQLENQQKNEIQNKHYQILQRYDENDIDTILTIKSHCYTNDNPTQRMNDIYNKSQLWNTMVDNYTYIRGQHGNAKFTEIWNLKINSGFLTNHEAKKIYKEICYLIGYET